MLKFNFTTKKKQDVAPRFHVPMGTMGEEMFYRISTAITAAAHRISPSKSNGRVPEFLQEVMNIFNREHIPEDYYWQEVLERSPKKAVPHQTVVTG